MAGRRLTESYILMLLMGFGLLLLGVSIPISSRGTGSDAVRLMIVISIAVLLTAVFSVKGLIDVNWIKKAVKDGTLEVTEKDRLIVDEIVHNESEERKFGRKILRAVLYASAIVIDALGIYVLFSVLTGRL